MLPLPLAHGATEATEVRPLDHRASLVVRGASQLTEAIRPVAGKLYGPMAGATKGAGSGGFSRAEPPPVVAGYIRVSSRTQDYEYQRHAIEQAARARGELVHRWYGDRATGSRMDRPALIKMRDAIRAGQIQRLWVWRLDRLTRSGIVDAISCIREMRKHGCVLCSVADGFPFDGEFGELFIAIASCMAQHEREKIRENLAAARARMAAAGRPWGKPAASDEQRALVSDLRREGKSIRQISRELRVLGLPLGKSCVCNILRSVPAEKAAS